MTDKPVVANDFRREPASLLNDELHAMERVLRSGWWVLGSEVKAFERSWAGQTKTTHAIGVGNGLDAIEIILRSLGIGAGDEVVTTAVTAYATSLAIQRSGATPVYADIDPDTACLSAESVASCITKATKAVLVVHLYGRAAEMDSLQSVCNTHGIILLEDCAQAHGAQHRGRPVGSIGQCGAWSFYPTKNLGAIGDAGAITTSDAAIAETAFRLRNYGQTDRYYHLEIGMNSRLDELQAALLNVRLPWLETWTNRRRQIAYAYRTRINHPLLDHLAQEETPESHVHHLYVIRTANRGQARRELDRRGISTLIHYPVASHEQPAATEYRLAPDGVPHALKHCMTCFSLPIHPYLSDDEVERVVDACNQLEL